MTDKVPLNNITIMIAISMTTKIESHGVFRFECILDKKLDRDDLLSFEIP